MNKLWIFGDSFSSEFEYNITHGSNKNNFVQYKERRDVDNIKTWSKILGEMLDYEVVNLAKGGYSNYQIFEDYANNCKDIQPGDIVIIGWALITKFRLSGPNGFINVHPNNTFEHDIVSKSSMDELVNNRRAMLWIKEVQSWEKGIKNIASHKGYDVYFWSGEEDRFYVASSKDYLCPDSTTCLMNYLSQNGCTTIYHETDGEISDMHFGIEGQQKQAEIFYNQVKK